VCCRRAGGRKRPRHSHRRRLPSPRRPTISICAATRSSARALRLQGERGRRRFDQTTPRGTRVERFAGARGAHDGLRSAISALIGQALVERVGTGMCPPYRGENAQRPVSARFASRECRSAGSSRPRLGDAATTSRSAHMRTLGAEGGHRRRLGRQEVDNRSSSRAHFVCRFASASPLRFRLIGDASRVPSSEVHRLQRVGDAQG